MKVLTIAVVDVALVLVAPAAAHLPKHAPYTNCTTFNKKYPHGVGRVGARDRSPNPVTTFKRSNAIYAAAMLHNSGLDRDKDKVACEKA